MGNNARRGRYGSNTELVREWPVKGCDTLPDVLKDPEPNVRFPELGDSALTFRLYIWAYLHKRWMVISGINFEIDRIFRGNKIEIAFPQRDIHIRSYQKRCLRLRNRLTRMAITSSI